MFLTIILLYPSEMFSMTVFYLSVLVLIYFDSNISLVSSFTSLAKHLDDIYLETDLIPLDLNEYQRLHNHRLSKQKRVSTLSFNSDTAELKSEKKIPTSRNKHYETLRASDIVHQDAQKLQDVAQPSSPEVDSHLADYYEVGNEQTSNDLNQVTIQLFSTDSDIVKKWYDPFNFLAKLSTKRKGKEYLTNYEPLVTNKAHKTMTPSRKNIIHQQRITRTFQAPVHEAVCTSSPFDNVHRYDTIKGSTPPKFIDRNRQNIQFTVIHMGQPYLTTQFSVEKEPYNNYFKTADSNQHVFLQDLISRKETRMRFTGTKLKEAEEKFITTTENLYLVIPLITSTSSTTKVEDYYFEPLKKHVTIFFANTSTTKRVHYASVTSKFDLNTILDVYKKFYQFKQLPIFTATENFTYRQMKQTLAINRLNWFVNYNVTDANHKNKIMKSQTRVTSKPAETVVQIQPSRTEAVDDFYLNVLPKQTIFFENTIVHSLPVNTTGAIRNYWNQFLTSESQRTSQTTGNTYLLKTPKSENVSSTRKQKSHAVSPNFSPFISLSTSPTPYIVYPIEALKKSTDVINIITGRPSATNFKQSYLKTTEVDGSLYWLIPIKTTRSIDEYWNFIKKTNSQRLKNESNLNIMKVLQRTSWVKSQAPVNPTRVANNYWNHFLQFKSTETSEVNDEPIMTSGSIVSMFNQIETHMTVTLSQKQTVDTFYLTTPRTPTTFDNVYYVTSLRSSSSPNDFNYYIPTKGNYEWLETPTKLNHVNYEILLRPATNNRIHSESWGLPALTKDYVFYKPTRTSSAPYEEIYYESLERPTTAKNVSVWKEDNYEVLQRPLLPYSLNPVVIIESPDPRNSAFPENIYIEPLQIPVVPVDINNVTSATTKNIDYFGRLGLYAETDNTYIVQHALSPTNMKSRSDFYWLNNFKTSGAIDETLDPDNSPPAFKTLWIPTSTTRNQVYSFKPNHQSTFYRNLYAEDVTWPYIKLLVAPTTEPTSTTMTKAFPKYYTFFMPQTESAAKPTLTVATPPHSHKRHKYDTNKFIGHDDEYGDMSDVALRKKPAASCYVCGLNVTGIPTYPSCYQLFDSKHSKFKFRRQFYKTKCMNTKYSKGKHYYRGGCFKRWVDLGNVYSERGCRTAIPTLGKSFASKRLAMLEVALKKVDVGCLTGPHASLTPLSKTVSLFARYHVCVCLGRYCNSATKISISVVLISFNIILKI